MRRRHACGALMASLRMPALAAVDDAARRTVLLIAPLYAATPEPHYVNALLISAQRRLGRPGLTAMARTATAALRGAVRDRATPTDWPRLAGYAALAQTATLDGDSVAGSLSVQALRSVLTDTATGPRLGGLRPWTDDMFMATLLLDRTAPLLAVPERIRATAALGTALLDLCERLQRPDHLFDHAEGSPFAWGRGNGFASLALAHALAGPLRDSHAAPRLLVRLQGHLLALLPLQCADGLWRQVLDQPAAAGEFTGTAMNLCALATARRLGWLSVAVDEPIARAWAGLQLRTGADGRLRDVCAGTPAGPTLDFYLQRPMVNGRDERAAALLLLAALGVGG